jgi:hypothetical protein
MLTTKRAPDRSPARPREARLPTVVRAPALAPWRGAVGLGGLVAALGLAASGCGLCGDVVCGACPAPLTLRVTDDQTGGAVAELTVAGAEALCDVPAGADVTSCDVQIGVGVSELVLSAPGYEDAALSVTINADSGESCCSCGYNSKILDVTMSHAP